MKLFRKKIDQTLLEAIYKYTVKRDEQDLVYVLYCNRCLALVDISPFSKDISESCSHHDAMHLKAQIGYCYSSCSLIEAEDQYMLETEDLDELLRLDAMWYRRMFWQQEAKAAAQLDGRGWHDKLCRQFGHGV